MSELYKAMKRIEDYQSTKPLYKQIAEIKGIASTARYGYDIQPQLTIPKSIAEMIDKEIMADAVTKFAMFHEGFERFWLSYELQMYCAKKKDYALVSAYLAGKALGVDLVKVVEG
ncbi:hypothetical protein [Lactococcus lactis]|uniref:Uncharacterized protein n=1 Tax=Lactococcus lactis TaxID=1358 RepID=A0AAP5UF24_9LACT|nr:hypothetical protein [Lactococcus lactis]MDT2860961.1 hypothetical protein [Lactococcus lactis]MDT2871863.1 hypothetical protein [Lactococcus lactis]MDT2881381.1 hypothetical protein [Lactococcus lactis]MDT2904347.1 hypothetical protein [Lactococcus lactis]MDT2917544.1 hypothetical protein [Lactococcus lactis]